MSFGTFAEHLQTNCIGPIVTAQRLLASRRGIGSVVFMSSDSGSAGRFLDYEDGFAAYAASKAALNQALRHMAAELRRERRETVVLALHPGEVST
jgi:NAD(P)-dependent dehydrogenase (short-subunit alcohol dehydrogenase family)